MPRQYRFNSDRPVARSEFGCGRGFRKVAAAEKGESRPYIGEDAGYVQVVRLSGRGPVLLVVPDGHTPFEAWKPILDHRDRATGKGLLDNDPTPRGTTFDGSYDWMVHSAGFASTDWKGSGDFDPKTRTVRLHLTAATTSVPLARLRLSETAMGSSSRSWAIASKPHVDAGPNVIRLGTKETSVVLRELQH